MRAFLVACLAIVAVAVGGYYWLGTVQQPSGVAYATDGARINTSWAWRSVLGPGDAQAGCDMRTDWQWIFVDLGKPGGEPAVCSISQ